jgi:hypothetical protein
MMYDLRLTIVDGERWFKASGMLALPVHLKTLNLVLRLLRACQ